MTRRNGCYLLALCCFWASSSSAQTITLEEEVVEIVEEEITYEVTETVPVEVITTGTSEDLMGDWSISGGTMITGDGVRFDYRGGTATQTFDLSQYDSISQINYSFDAIGCNNSIGGSCADPKGPLDYITVTMTYGQETWSDTVEMNYLNGFQTYDFTYNPTGYADTATLSLYGIDPGYWGGWYGGIAINHDFTVDYTMTEIVLQEVTRVVTETVQREVTRIVTRTIEVPDVVSVDTPAVVDIAPIAIPAPEPVAPPPPTVVEVQVSNTQQEVVASFSIDVSETIEEISSDGEASTEELSASVESAVRREVNVDSGGGYDPVSAAVAVAVMAQTPAAQGFAQYQQQSIPSVPFYAPVALDGGTVYDNPMGRFFSGASEVRWDQMVESQWQR